METLEHYTTEQEELINLMVDWFFYIFDMVDTKKEYHHDEYLKFIKDGDNAVRIIIESDIGQEILNKYTTKNIIINIQKNKQRLGLKQIRALYGYCKNFISIRECVSILNGHDE